MRPDLERQVKDYQPTSIVNPPQYDTLQPVGDGPLTAHQLNELRNALDGAVALHAALPHSHDH
ncbi:MULTISPECIES: hypothetical protein [Streptomyces]|uniref:Uncharacterized protein n=1 Tax=Streptomyces venezuelae TaxID=54571 RepID=A0A5P2AKY1_STRVZ|nr:hypothetical protein [Streptomyces venezuelae]QES18765.1 hypothetical protein DEJ46_06425 [Streptomyces venezuelae]